MAASMTNRPSPLTPGAGIQNIASHAVEENVSSRWSNLQRNPQFNEYKRQIYESIALHDKAYFHYCQLREDPEATAFLDAHHFAIHWIPPADIWLQVVRLRQHPDFMKIRNSILKSMKNAATTGQFYNTPSTRISGASHRSLAHLSIHSESSARNSGISSHTEDLGPIGTMNEAGEQEQDPVWSTVKPGEEALHPDPPYVLASAKGKRKAPDGQCFACPMEQCNGKSFYSREGDWLNHMKDKHAKVPRHDSRRYLCKDPRPRATPARSEAAEEAAKILLSDSPDDSWPEKLALSDGSSRDTQSQPASDQVTNLPNPVDFTEILFPPGYYGNTGIGPMNADQRWINNDANMQL